jgi:hypothetical protein
VLETGVTDPDTLAGWTERVRLARQELRWPDAPLSALPHANGASLALSTTETVSVLACIRWSYTRTAIVFVPTRDIGNVCTSRASSSPEALNVPS